MLTDRYGLLLSTTLGGRRRGSSNIPIAGLAAAH
jgi:hypothetical protein